MRNRFFSHFPISFFAVVVFLCIVAIFNLYSATYKDENALYMTQATWIAIGFFIMLFFALIDYRIFERFAYAIYAAGLFLLVLVLMVGPKISGARRWIDLGVFHLQPSELMKISMVIMLAKYFHDDHRMGGYSIFQLFVPISLLMMTVVLVMVEPDLGTALLICFVAGTIFLFVKIRWQSLVIVGIIGILSVPLAYQFVLKDYQKDRVKTFLNPSRDPRGKGYHALQSMIAVGSGKLYGKGHLKGSQTQLAFLPEQQTDFIFSVYAEEHGFVGVVILLAAYLAFIFMGLAISRQARDKFGAILALGLTSIFFWHVLINIGMVIGIMPVVGITLPFFSYGGSALWISMVAVGLLMSIHMRRFTF